MLGRFVAFAALCTFASVATATTTFYGCVEKNGSFSVVSQTTPCKAGATRIEWNQTGPIGPQGPPGPPGAAGASWIDADGRVIGPALTTFENIYWRTSAGLVVLSPLTSETNEVVGVLVGVQVEYQTQDCSGPAYTAHTALGLGFPIGLKAIGPPIASSVQAIRTRPDLPRATQIGSSRSTYSSPQIPGGSCITYPAPLPLGQVSTPWYQFDVIDTFNFRPPFILQ